MPINWMGLGWLPMDHDLRLRSFTTLVIHQVTRYVIFGKPLLLSKARFKGLFRLDILQAKTIY
jgi:hypothetical protein